MDPYREGYQSGIHRPISYYDDSYMSEYHSYVHTDGDADVLLQGVVDSYNRRFLMHHQSISLMTYEQSKVDNDLYKWQQVKHEVDGKEVVNQVLSSGDDSGINLVFTEDIEVPAKAIGFTIDFKVQVEVLGHGYWLLPRSSIGKTPLRQANSMGLIDAGYRGNLMVKVDNLSDQPVKLCKGHSLFQLCMPSLTPWKLIKVPMLSQTQRAQGGFGSTGK